MILYHLISKMCMLYFLVIFFVIIEDKFGLGKKQILADLRLLHITIRVYKKNSDLPRIQHLFWFSTCICVVHDIYEYFRLFIIKRWIDLMIFRFNFLRRIDIITPWTSIDYYWSPDTHSFSMRSLTQGLSPHRFTWVHCSIHTHRLIFFTKI